MGRWRTWMRGGDEEPTSEGDELFGRSGGGDDRDHTHDACGRAVGRAKKIPCADGTDCARHAASSNVGREDDNGSLCSEAPAARARVCGARGVDPPTSR